MLYADRGKARVPEAEWVALVRAVADGDQRALRALYERTERIVYTLAVRITRQRETAEEVTLDVFHDVWRRASSYEPGGGSVVGWIMNQARSRAIDRLRFEQRKKRVGTRANVVPPPPSAAEPDEVPQLLDEERRLRAALALLTPDERRAIETAYFGGLTYAQTAERLELPLGTVKTRIRAALEKLRHALGREGWAR